MGLQRCCFSLGPFRPRSSQLARADGWRQFAQAIRILADRQLAWRRSATSSRACWRVPRPWPRSGWPTIEPPSTLEWPLPSAFAGGRKAAEAYDWMIGATLRIGIAVLHAGFRIGWVDLIVAISTSAAGRQRRQCA